MGFFCEGEIWIPRDEWIEFVMQYIPDSPAETVLGKPVINKDDEMVVPFACNTECNPENQSPPPRFIQAEQQKSKESES